MIRYHFSYHHHRIPCSHRIHVDKRASPRCAILLALAILLGLAMLLILSMLLALGILLALSMLLEQKNAYTAHASDSGGVVKFLASTRYTSREHSLYVSRALASCSLSTVKLRLQRSC